MKTNVLPEYHLVEGMLERDIDEHTGPTTSPGALLASLPRLICRCPLCCCSHIHCRALPPEAIAEFAEKRRNYLRWESSLPGQRQVFGERRCQPDKESSSSCTETVSRLSPRVPQRLPRTPGHLIIQTIKLQNIMKFYSVFLLKKFIGKPHVSDTTCFFFDSNHLDSKYSKAKKVIAVCKAR